MRRRTWIWARLAAVVTVLAGVVPTTAAAPAAAAGAAWSSLSVGAQSACGVRVDGSLWCWGSNGAGQLGDGSTVLSRPAPVQVGAATGWASVDVGGGSCWGFGGVGALGSLLPIGSPPVA